MTDMQDMPGLLRVLMCPDGDARSAFETVRPRATGALKWHAGPPPHVGWWLTRSSRQGESWRWWRGDGWTHGVQPDATHEQRRAATRRRSAAAGILWCADWPEGARVPRVNPETSEVTGQ